MAAAREKRTGWDFWKSIGAPKLVVAPMVDQSEYAWRILSRRYGAQLCYTPMFHARMFAEDPKYRRAAMQTGPTDRPLFVQFCANSPDHLLAAAKHVEGDCDAVDLNLGCPQHIAKRGHYGSFLMEDWDLIFRMVKNLADNLSIPVTVKIRVFPDANKTIEYARMIERAGASVLTVHGRLREQKGHKTGLADWEQIRRVKESVSIPVIANGNILYCEDIHKCLEATGVDAVMTAEGNLYNPAIFTGEYPTVWRMAEEYLDIVRENPDSAELSMVRGHLFKIFKPCLNLYTDIRDNLARVNTLAGFAELTATLKARLEVESASYPDVQDGKEWLMDDRGIRKIPHWLVQPYVRPENVNGKGGKEEREGEEAETGEEVGTTAKRKSEGDMEPNGAVGDHAVKKPRPSSTTSTSAQPPICPICQKNAASGRCVFAVCKQCCRQNVREGKGDTARVEEVESKAKGGSGGGKENNGVKGGARKEEYSKAWICEGHKSWRKVKAMHLDEQRSRTL